ncbi:MAG: 50S ribosomal protein L20 [Bacteroidetes bacterium]|jgi:large subunit ribosomal protein L20|nr:50S ribosomal protein L20 [Bacteroidota bacterium]
MRSVNKVASHQRRKRILKLAKGYWGRKKNVWTVAKNQIEKSLKYAYTGRKLKKRDFRRLWIQRINAGSRLNGLSYSKLIHNLKTQGIDLNRKVLADLAMNHPEVFAAVSKEGASATAPVAARKEAAPAA